MRVITYKRKRDVLKSPRPAIWEVVPHEWAASMYDLGASASVMSRATAIRILWDKHMHGRNLGTRSSQMIPPAHSGGGADSQYYIIRKYSHRTMQACRQKHIALLDIRKRDLGKKRHPISPLFETYLAFATTLGEPGLSHTAWTDMLAPELLAALETANGTAGLNGAQAHRCLLRHAKFLTVATRDLYRTRCKRLREIRGENNRTLYHRDRMETGPKPTMVPAHMGIRPFTESHTSAALLTRSTRWSDAHRLESLEEPPRTRHCPTTPAGKLGLDLGPLDYTAAAWDMPHEVTVAMDSDEDSLTLHDDTVYYNAYDTDDNVYDVNYYVHEEMDIDYGEPWSAGIG